MKNEDPSDRQSGSPDATGPCVTRTGRAVEGKFHHVSIDFDRATSSDGTGKFPGAETARRTLRLLEALAARQPIGLDELAEVVGLNRSTTYRLLRVLQDEGYSERLPRGGYRLGPAVAALVSGPPLPADVLEPARPALQRLAEMTGESVGLHRRAGDLVVLCYGVESEQHALRHVIRVGESNSLLAGSAGNAILAALGDADRTAVLDRGGLRPDARRALDRNLAEIAARGYALSRGANHPGLFGIAAAVLPPDGGAMVELSVSVSGPDSRWTEDHALRHVDDLLRCCAQLSHLLPVHRAG
jgi:IclR family transcriptional regulator, acetate operon repressor